MIAHTTGMKHLKIGMLCGFTSPNARVYFLPGHSYGNVNRDLTLQIVVLFDNDE
jgi:hypothetical protein